jgi:putative membrane protein (TIGR04086 family)
MKRISWLGVIVGGVSDIVSSAIFSFIILFAVMATLPRQPLPPAETQAALNATILTSPRLIAVSLVLGALSSVFGGYVAAAIAKHDRLLNGALSTWLYIASGIYGWVNLKLPISAYEHLLGIVASPLFGLLGGYLSERIQKTQR